jgi:hypothetical protein
VDGSTTLMRLLVCIDVPHYRGQGPKSLFGLRHVIPTSPYSMRAEAELTVIGLTTRTRPTWTLEVSRLPSALSSSSTPKRLSALSSLTQPKRVGTPLKFSAWSTPSKPPINIILTHLWIGSQLMMSSLIRACPTRTRRRCFLTTALSNPISDIRPYRKGRRTEPRYTFDARRVHPWLLAARYQDLMECCHAAASSSSSRSKYSYLMQQLFYT